MHCYNKPNFCWDLLIASIWINVPEDETGNGRKATRCLIVTVFTGKKWGDPKKTFFFFFNLNCSHTPSKLTDFFPMYVSKLKGMNFQSTAWKICPQIPLVVMWFVCLSAMQCFESSFLYIQLQPFHFQNTWKAYTHTYCYFWGWQWGAGMAPRPQFQG